MTNIAFIGLGIMGSPMAVHLPRPATPSPATTAPRQDPAARRRRRHGRRRRSPTPCGTPTSSRVMVPDSPDVAGGARRRGRRLRQRQAGHAGHRLLQHPPRRHRRAGQGRPRSKGFRLLDAPVSGGEAGAMNAALSIMVGGAAEDFAEAEPLFDAVGKTVVHVGRHGAGQTVKAANQLIVAANIQALAEAVVFLEAYGVDTGPRSRCSAAGWPAPRCWTRRARTCSTVLRARASGSTCTTRTWASSPPRPARPAWSSRSARSSPS